MLRLLLVKTVRDLRAALAQSLALIVIVALGVASFIALAAAYRDLGTSYEATYDALHFADVSLAVQGAPAAVADDLARTPGVAAVTGRLVIDAGLELPASRTGADTETIRARLIGVPAGAHPAVNDVSVLDGRYLEAADSQAALLEAHFADVYTFKPGDHVTVLAGGGRVDFEVAGVAASPEYLIVSPSRQEIVPSARTFAVLFVPLDELQSLAGAEGMVNDLSVRFAPGADPDAVIADLEEQLAPYGLLSMTRREDQPSAAALKLDLDGYKELSELMPLLILLAAAGSLYAMLGRQVRAQRPQIGLMKAVGYTDRAVLGQVLSAALVIGLAGAVLGVALGVPMGQGITTVYAQELGIPLVRTKVYPDLMAEAVGLTLVVVVLAGWGPARGSARLAPAQAMRQDAALALVAGRHTLLEKWLTAPLWLRLPLRNVFRVPRRSLSTGLGLVFAFVLVLTALGLSDSMGYMLQRQFQTVEQWDLQAAFETPQAEGLLDSVAAWPGVRQVEPVLLMPATVTANGQDQEIVLTAMKPGQTMHALAGRGGKAVDVAQGELLLPATLAEKLELQPGDRLTVDTFLGKREMTLGGTVEELMSSAGYISLDEAQDWSGSPTPLFNGLWLTADPAQAGALRTRLFELPGAASVQLKSAVEADWRSLMGLFYVFVGVVLAIALAMAFALLFNAMTVNVLEQQRELATLRALGVGRRGIAGLTLAENMLLWLLVLLPGLLLGRWVALQMGQAFASDLFAFDIHIAPLSYALTALGILVTMMLAAWPAIRRVNRLNLAQATKVLA